MDPSTHSRLFKLILFLLFCSSMTHVVNGQETVDAKVNNVIAWQIPDQNNRVLGWAVVVTFNQNFNPNNPVDVAKARNSSSYRIIEVKSGAFVAVSQVSLIQIPNLSVTRVRLVVPGADSLNTKDLFHFFALDLAFDGKPAAAPSQLQAPIDVKQQADTTPKTTTIDPKAPPKPAWALAASKGKDDSDIYGSYNLTKSRGAATTGSGDLKIAIPFTARFWHRRNTLSPDIEINASSDAGADPDSLKFAFDWGMPVHEAVNSDKKFRIVNLINSGVIEAPKNFNNINALWTSRWLFPSTNLAGSGKPVKIFLDPFVGHELGKNLKSPLSTAEGKGLARLITGANLHIQVPISNLRALKGLEFNTSYMRRWLLKRELLVDKDDSGKLVLLSLGKGPKDYSDSKFTVKINDFFGPFVGYEWGRLPPNYDLVDHKWTFGLLFKAKVKVE